MKTNFKHINNIASWNMAKSSYAASCVFKKVHSTAIYST